MAVRNERGGWDLTDADAEEVMRMSFGEGDSPAGGQTGKTVFLGGVCGNTTWRDDIAIPMLKSAGITYYNPQVSAGQWRDELIDIEAAAKEKAKHILVVITGETRASASIQGATEHALLNRAGLSLVIDDMVDGTIVEGVKITGSDLSDANRARAYLRSVVRRHRPDIPIYHSPGVPVRDSVGLAVQGIIDLEKGNQPTGTRGAVLTAWARLRLAGTALHLTPGDMREMHESARDLVAAFPSYFESR